MRGKVKVFLSGVVLGVMGVAWGAVLVVMASRVIH